MRVVIAIHDDWTAFPAELARLMATARQLEIPPEISTETRVVGGDSDPTPALRERRFGEGLLDDEPDNHDEPNQPVPLSQVNGRGEPGKRFWQWAKDEGDEVLKLVSIIGERRGFPSMIKLWSAGMVKQVQEELDRRLVSVPAGTRNNGRAACRN